MTRNKKKRAEEEGKEEAGLVFEADLTGSGAASFTDRVEGSSVTSAQFAVNETIAGSQDTYLAKGAFGTPLSENLTSNLSVDPPVAGKLFRHEAFVLGALTNHQESKTISSNFASNCAVTNLGSLLGRHIVSLAVVRFFVGTVYSVSKKVSHVEAHLELERLLGRGYPLLHTFVYRGRQVRILQRFEHMQRPATVGNKQALKDRLPLVTASKLDGRLGSFVTTGVLVKLLEERFGDIVTALACDPAWELFERQCFGFGAFRLSFFSTLLFRAFFPARQLAEERTTCGGHSKAQKKQRCHCRRKKTFHERTPCS